MKQLKTSKYNHFFKIPDSDSFLAYNCVKNGLAKVSADIVETLNHLESNDIIETDNTELPWEPLIKGGFLIENDVDELSVVEFFYRQKQYSTKVLVLSIAPTFKCNLRCPYCYVDKESIKMDKKVIDDLIKFVENSLNYKRHERIEVVWFGGEPLVASDIIISISQRIKKLCEDSSENCKVSHVIITNGTLLNREFVNQMIPMGLKRIQVTLDGTREVHNARRPFVGGKSSFDKILHNVEEILGLTKLTIRINCEKTNYKNAYELVNFLDEKCWFKKENKCGVTLGMLVSFNETCSNVSDICYNTEEFTEIEYDFKKFLVEKKIPTSTIYPDYSNTHCVANAIHVHLVDPQGYLYPCWSVVGRKDFRIGTLREPTLELGHYLQWKEFSPISDSECVDCNFLPICMGGCPYLRRYADNPEDGCTFWKFNMDKMMMLKYQLYCRKADDGS